MAVIDGIPVTTEYPESIQARWLGSMNAGLDPSDPAYADDQGWARGVVGAGSLEIDRVYDRTNEILVASLPSTATGPRLDAWAAVVKLQRKVAVAATGIVRFNGPDGTNIPTGFPLSTEAPSASADPVSFITTQAGTIASGSVDLLVRAVDAGTIGNVAANSITILDSYVGDSVTISNSDRITGGDDVESDERLQQRLGKKIGGTGGAGNADFYENLMLNLPGVGFVTVIANDPAISDVKIVIADVNNDPVSSVLIAQAQALVDPSGVATQGAGQAPVGAEVAVTTPTPLDLAIVATIVPEDGYTVDGAGGTISLADDVKAAVQAYIDSLTVGEHVVHSKVVGAIVSVEGVDDATGVDLGAGVGANLPVGSTQVAVIDSFTAS